MYRFDRANRVRIRKPLIESVETACFGPKNGTAAEKRPFPLSGGPHPVIVRQLGQPLPLAQIADPKKPIHRGMGWWNEWGDELGVNLWMRP